jgi:hypothetical protein
MSLVVRLTVLALVGANLAKICVNSIVKKTGTHPHSGLIFCGIDQEALFKTWYEIGTMVMKTAMSSIQLCSEIEKDGFDPTKIPKLAEIVSKMAEEFAKPMCNASREVKPEEGEGEGENGELAQTRDDSKLYDDAIHVFGQFDRNHDGNVDHTELTAQVFVLGRNIKLPAGVMTEIDTSNDNMVQFNEFVQFLRKKDILSIPNNLPSA